MKPYCGKVLFLDRSDITSDEIVPSKYLEGEDKQALQPYLFEDLKLDGFNSKRDLSNVKVVITRENFGCGQCNDRTTWALETNGILCVIAVNFAKLFKQNMCKNSMLALDMSKKDIDEMFHTFADKDTECKIEQKDDGTWKVKLIAGSLSTSFKFKVEGAEKAALENLTK